MVRYIFVLSAFLFCIAYAEYQLRIGVSSSDDMAEKLQILKDIGIEDCKIYEHEIVCAKTKDINEALRIRDYLERNNIIAFIEEVSTPSSSNLRLKKENNKEEKVSEKYKKILKLAKNLQCIQVSTSKVLKFEIPKYEKLKNYPLARIEKIGSFYVLRVGGFKEYSKAKELLQKVKKQFPDAFIRRCDIIPQRIVYPSDFVLKKEKNIDLNSPEKKIMSKISSKKVSLVELMYQELNSGNLSKAEEIAKKLVKKGKNLDDAYFVLGLINLQKGNFGEACKNLDKSYKISLKPDVKKVRNDACYTYAMEKGYKNMEKNPKIALLYFKKAKEFKNTLKTQIAIGYAYLNSKQYEKAYQIFKNLYQKSPNNDEILKGYITALINLKKDEELDQVVKKTPEEKLKPIESLVLYNRLKSIRNLIKDGKLDLAEKQLKELYKKFPSNIAILLELGNLYLKKDELSKAKSYYKNVLILEPNNVYALQGLKAIYVKEGNYEKALEITKKLEEEGIKVDDKEKILVLYYLNQANKYEKEKNYTKAKDLYEKVLEIEPNNPYALIGLGDIYYKQGDKQKALRFYSVAYENAKNNFDVKLKFLYSLLDLELYDQIMNILEDIKNENLTNEQKKKLKKFYKVLYVKYAMYLFNERDYKNSLKVAKEGLLIFPNDKDLLHIAGWSCYNLKDYDCAERYFLKVYEEKKDENTAIGLAYIYLNTDKKQKAKEILLKLENSKDPKILVEVANIYEALGEDEKAEEIINKLEKKQNLKSIEAYEIIEEKQEGTNENPETIIPNPFLENSMKLDNKYKRIVIKKKRQNKVYDSNLDKKIKLIKNKLTKKKQNYLSNISFGGKFRYKSGDKGTTLLYVYTPFILGEYFFNQYSYLYYGAYYPFISSGGTPNYTQFGTVQNPIIRETNTSGSGLEPLIGYKFEKGFILKGELTYTPIGNTPVNPALLANFGLGKKFGQNKLYFEIGRYIEKNTLLSYIGSKDPHSQKNWGRVLENRISLDYERLLDKNDSLVFASVRYSSLNGKNTNKNEKLDLILLPKFFIGDSFLTEDYIGLYFQYMKYKKDEDLYYFGNGGYFSPQNYFMLSPMYEGFYFNKNGNWGIIIKLMAGILSIDTSRYNETTLAFDAFLGGEKILSNRFSLKGGIEFRKTTSYTEVFSLVSLNYYFGIKTFVRKQDLLKLSREVIR